MINQKNILFPEKISQVLCTKWEHPKIPDENDEYKKVRYDTSSFIFNLPNELILSFNQHFQPASIQLSSNNKREIFTISFENINKVKYLFRYKILILESRQKDYFSQIWVSSEGIFRMRVGVPISDYESYAWTISMGDGKEEEIYQT